MASVASGGAAERIAARILFKVLRAGSGTPARYSSTFFGAPLPFAADLRLPDFTFFMRAMLQEAPIQVYASVRRSAKLAPRLQRKRRACGDHEGFCAEFRGTICYPASRETSISD